MEHFGIARGHFSARWDSKAWSGIKKVSSPQPAKATQPGIKTRDTGAKHAPGLEMLRSTVVETSTSSVTTMTVHVLTAYPDGTMKVHAPELVH